MLYLDSSVLVKRYVREKGTDRVAACFRGGEAIHTSTLAYAEVLAAFERRLREGLMSVAEADAVLSAFLLDWSENLHEIALDQRVLAPLPGLLRAHALRGSDGIHLASALWLRGAAQPAGERVVFGVTGEKLGAVARACGLPVFNPEIAKNPG